MLKYCLLSFLFLIPFTLIAQNLVPNPSFEEIEKVSVSWISNHQIFENRMKEWTTPNLGSPDIFSNKIIPRFLRARKGVILEPHQARTGEVMVGIKTYGCATYTQHCKEYLQIKLREPIQYQKEYYVEFWVNPMSTTLLVNNIGLVFSDVEIQDDSEYGIHYFVPVVNELSIIQTAPNDWVKIAGTVKSDGDYQYIIIGNFYTDEETQTKDGADRIAYSYYFIDDVMVRPVDAGPIELATAELKTGNTISLSKIQFESGKTILLKNSYQQLKELLKILKENENMQIQINGHTDSEGEEKDNLQLSNDRAKTVADYLTKNGILSDRLISKGYGESSPITSNESTEGRKLNRRVEFFILKE